MHYMRGRKNGFIDVGEPSHRFRPGERNPNKEGYIDLWDNERRVKVFEHRVVMGMMLGRAMLGHERVHHINGVRHDNRPENLELWSTSQPPGQRVVDKVAWAKELLALYDPEALS